MQNAGADESPLRDRLILVIGARRSGTHWIGRIIGTNPDVIYLPSETFLFAHLDSFAQNFHATRGSKQVARMYVERERLVRGLRAVCDEILLPWVDDASPQTRILERSPVHIDNLELISELYPEAHIVHIIRDGRDVARSLATARWGPGSAVEGAKEWVQSVTTGRRRPMKNYHEVRYERIFANPRQEITELFKALGLPAEDQHIEAALLEGEVAVNHDPTMPAVIAEKWRTGLTARDLAEVEEVAGDLLTELGFELASPPGARKGRPRFSGGSVIAAARRVASGRKPAAPAQRAGGDAFEWAQHTVDDFVEHVRAGRLDKARALLDPLVQIQVWTSAEEWDGRGDEVAERFLNLLATDEVVNAPHVRSDVHAALPALTIVFAAGGENRVESRTLVLHLRANVIVRVAFYGLG